MSTSKRNSSIDSISEITSSNILKNIGEWDGDIYFINNTNEPNELFTGREIRDLQDPFQQITDVWLYTKPISKTQMTSFIFYHAFVVFKTENSFWSVEKKGSRIWIQRSNEKDAVKNTFKGKTRGSITELKKDQNSMFVLEDLIRYLENKELLNSYWYIQNYTNDKRFAKRVYKLITYHSRICFLSGSGIPKEILSGRNMDDLGDLSEQITDVGHYKEALFWCIQTHRTSQHSFIVFKTANWYWSIEKDKSNIWIQKSDQIVSVRDRFNSTIRGQIIPITTIIPLADQRFVCKLRDLIKWVEKTEFLNKYFPNSSDKTFMDEAYKFITYDQGIEFVSYSNDEIETYTEKEMRNRFNFSLHITKVWYYKFSTSNNKIKHFVLFEDQEERKDEESVSAQEPTYWSIEINEYNICIQRSNQKDTVMGKFKNESRAALLPLEDDQDSIRTLNNLIDWIKDSELSRHNFYPFSKYFIQNFEESVYKFLTYHHNIYFINSLDISVKTYKVEEINDHFDLSEQITDVWLCKTDLPPLELKTVKCIPIFVVFKTTKLYWSMERKENCIWMQMSDEIDTVRKTLEGKPRGLVIDLEENHNKFCSISDLIEWVKNNELSSLYFDVIYSNVNRFAQSTYRFLTKHLNNNS